MEIISKNVAVPFNGEPKTRGGGGRLSRSETVTVRLDPKLRYLAELASRKQRRTLSSFIEWAVEESLDRVVLYEGEEYDNGPHVRASIASSGSFLWDVDESDRFIKLAFSYPDFFSHEEQILWKLIRENGSLWYGEFETKSPYRYVWKIDKASLKFEALRQDWEKFVSVADGKADKDILPSWEKIDPEPIPF